MSAKTFESGGKTYVEVTEAEQVTDEVLEIARDIESGWYNDVPIDWEDVWDRMEGTVLDDNRYLSLGNEMDSPAMKKIQRVIRAERRLG